MTDGLDIADNREPKNYMLECPMVLLSQDLPIWEMQMEIEVTFDWRVSKMELSTSTDDGVSCTHLRIEFVEENMANRKNATCYNISNPVMLLKTPWGIREMRG